jgi:hypothetical protein
MSRWPIGDPVPVQNDIVVALQCGYPSRPLLVPRELSAEAYKEFAARYGTEQSHDRLLERGGFGLYELTVLLFQRCRRLAPPEEKP